MRLNYPLGMGMKTDLFPPRPKVEPKIYAYSHKVSEDAGYLKVGETTRTVEERMRQIHQIEGPHGPEYTVELVEPALRSDGTRFRDHEVHRYLVAQGIKRSKREWFKCSVDQVRRAVVAVRNGLAGTLERDLDFEMRPEQAAAVQAAAVHFRRIARERSGKPARFLWNAKMRFGKTFATYKLAEEMGWKKVLVLTFKPAVQDAWKADLQRHVDFVDWTFIEPDRNRTAHFRPKAPFVCFGSFQDLLGKNESTKGIKANNTWVHATHWDCVVLDEYHFGAWRQKARDLFEGETGREAEWEEGAGLDLYDEKEMPITTSAYLYLSGTPFRALASGEFMEDQIFNWTYSDEQREKAAWKGPSPNPYRGLPRMVLMTYQVPEEIGRIARATEHDEFDLNEFFKAEGAGDQARFKHSDDVQKWLALLRGSYTPQIIADLRRGGSKPPMPYSDGRLLGALTHTLWFLPDVSSCYAMANLLRQPQNAFYHDYKVVVAAGSAAGIGVKALPPVRAVMEDPLHSKSITLSCGKLTTGVTVPPWGGILMLRNLQSPESYFQAAFRVQSPWVIDGAEDGQPESDVVIKEECYILDFAPTRALRQIVEYSSRLNEAESSPEKQIEEFIRFLPVLAYDGSDMRRINPARVLEWAMSSMTATMLARKWEDAALVNVDNDTLAKLLENEKAMQALSSIEGFRNLNKDIELVINKSDAVKEARRKANDKKLGKRDAEQLSDDEKEYRKTRKRIQQQLIKFATRIPVFMYLTDFREQSLRHVIQSQDPMLFRSVTGLEISDFDLLRSLGVFNTERMNDAVYHFRRYEDPSLGYTGIDRHAGEAVGLYDTVLSREAYEAVIENEM